MTTPTPSVSPTPTLSHPPTLDQIRSDLGMAAVGLCGGVVVTTYLTTTEGLYDAETGAALDMDVPMPAGSEAANRDAVRSIDWMCVRTGERDVTVAQYTHPLGGGRDFVVAFADDGSAMWTRPGHIVRSDLPAADVVLIDVAGREDFLVDPWTGEIIESVRWSAPLSQLKVNGALLVGQTRIVDPTGRLADIDGRRVGGERMKKPFVVIGDQDRVYDVRPYRARGVNVLAYSARTGSPLWSTRVPSDVPYEPYSGGLVSTYDASTDVAVWVAQGSLERLVAVDSVSGEVLWTKDGYDQPGVRAADGMVVCADLTGEADLFDVVTGRSIRLPDGLRPVDVGPSGVLVVAEDGSAQVLERSELVSG